MSASDNPSKITPSQVAHVAKLSRLALSDAELSRLAGELGSILQYVAQIDQVDNSAIQPTADSTAPANVLRDDVSTPPLPTAQVLQNAAKTDGIFFMVPKVVGGDEDSAG